MVLTCQVLVQLGQVMRSACAPSRREARRRPELAAAPELTRLAHVDLEGSFRFNKQPVVNSVILLGVLLISSFKQRSISFILGLFRFMFDHSQLSPGCPGLLM